MDDTYRNLPLEERIGAMRDGEVTNQGASVGSTPLTAQPKRKHHMSEEIAVNINAWNVDGRPFTSAETDDIVSRLRIVDHVYTEPWSQALMDEAAAEIERLRTELFRMHSQRLAAELAEIRAREADHG